jgi:hypothetical protein
MTRIDFTESQINPTELTDAQEQFMRDRHTNFTRYCGAKDAVSVTDESEDDYRLMHNKTIDGLLADMNDAELLHQGKQRLLDGALDRISAIQNSIRDQQRALSLLTAECDKSIAELKSLQERSAAIVERFQHDDTDENILRTSAWEIQ